MNSLIESANRAEQQAVVEKETKELVKLYSEADLEKQRSISVQLRRDIFMHDRPRTAEEIYKYLNIEYGLVLGTTVSDPQWTSPFEWAYHMFKDTYATTLTIAPRSGGKSYPAAAIAFDKCAHLPNYTAAHASAQQDQGDVTQVYLTNFSEDEALNYGLDKKGIGKKRGEWLTTKASWQIAGSTMSKISGKHPNMLTMDEIEFAEEAMIEQSWAVPMSKNGYKGTWVGFSTRQRACLPGHTRIITEDGPKMIRDIVNQKYSGRVRSFNFETFEYEWNEVIDWFNNGKTSDWWHVHLEFPTTGIGGSLTCTKEHQLVRPDGSKTCLSDLHPGDFVCIEDTYLSGKQLEILHGTFMGDGYVTPDGGFKIEHGLEQLDYLTWMHNALKGVSSNIRSSSTRPHLKEFTVNSTLKFKRIRRDYYTQEHKKHIPDWIWDELTPLSIAVWLMDDGCYAKTKKQKNGLWRIAACHFTPGERKRCSQFFEELGIPGYWYQFEKGRESSYQFLFRVESSKKLTELVSPYLSVENYNGKHKGWKRWVAESYNDDSNLAYLAPVQIASIEKADNQEGFKYDITVDKVHNYQVYSGVLVSNSGMMNKLIQDSETGKRDIKVFQWSIFESMEACRTCVALDQHPHGGTPEVEAARCDACPLWEFCRGEKARKVSGWMKREDVIATMSRMNRDSIETQLLCLRPSTHGVVLHNFRHEYANAGERSKGNYFAWTHQKDLPFYVWLDPAETKKGCALFVQVYNGRIFAFDEIVDDSGPTTEDLKEAVHKKCIDGGYGEPKRVVIDPRRTDTKKAWVSGTLEGIGKDHCFNAAFPNVKNGMDDIEAGLDLVRTYILNGIGERRFMINPVACPKFVEAITNNMYKVDKNNLIHQNTKQQEKFKDEIDTIRYGIIDLHRSGAGASV